MIDFTSALYLGLTHPSAALGRWDQLTTGAPAALVEQPEAPRVAAACAALIGVERAVLARSTLHAFFDLFAGAAAVVLDEACYPVARGGAERAVARGARLRTFRHRDPADLDRALARLCPGSPSWVVVDGLCTGCGRLAPLDALAAVALAHGAILVVDDTQALGLLGAAPRAGAPYGNGGGGSLRAAGCSAREVVVVASLAKAFGAPLAVVAGPDRTIQRFEETSEARVHSSPPSTADLRAAARALGLPPKGGDRLRLRLATLVRRLRDGARRIGCRAASSLFPVQRIEADTLTARELHARLMRRGVATVLHAPPCRPGAAVAVLVTCRHHEADIDAALAALAHAVRAPFSPRDRERRSGAPRPFASAAPDR